MSQRKCRASSLKINCYTRVYLCTAFATTAGIECKLAFLMLQTLLQQHCSLYMIPVDTMYICTVVALWYILARVSLLLSELFCGDTTRNTNRHYYNARPTSHRLSSYMCRGVVILVPKLRSRHEKERLPGLARASRIRCGRRAG